MAAAARIILLNGPGSVGKSSIARAMQVLARGPLLHLGMDRFCEMLPDRFQDHPDTFRFVTRTEAQAKVTEVETGHAGEALLRGMRQTVAALARNGVDLVVDDVWLSGEPADYAAHLQGHSVWRVGLTAPLRLLEARKAARDDRTPGLSRAQWLRVHDGVRYDLMLDMSELSSEAAAHRIVALADL